MERKTVLIVGGSGGIGRQIASDYLNIGQHVIITGKEQPQLDEVCQQLRQISPHCTAIQCNIALNEDVDLLAQQILQEYGCPDILINCAGYATYRTFEESPIAEIEDLIQVNLLGAMRCVKAFLPQMTARKSGTIVNVSSIAGRLLLTPNGIYTTAKHGMVIWSEILKHELARFGIRVHVICPGRVETGFFDHETFQTRAPRPETQYTIPVEEVGKATRNAIEKNRFLTYIPWKYGILVWLTNTVPWIIKPVYGWFIQNRIETYYQTQ